MPVNNQRFTGTVLVSGAATGIGRSIAESFLAAGAAVHICDASQENLDDFLAANSSASGTLADVSDAAQVDRVFADLNERYGGLNVLVNNAGIAGPTAAVEDVAVDAWDQCIAVDLSGTFYMTRRAVPLLKQRDAASIINISSTAGIFPCPLRSPYVASKWAIIGLTKTWAMELGPHNIRVNAICPGCVAGPRMEGVIERDAAERDVTAGEVRHVYERQSSMRTFIDADDVAGLAMFLASGISGKISGQVIGVDGHTETLANWLDQT